jgi:hypothetical protein
VPDPQSHADNRGFVESILRKIPGFKGYLEKEYRRESDYLARTWMADRLRQSKGGLDTYMRSLLDAGQIDAMAGCERVRTRLDGLENRLRAQVRGYSGFFDFVKVDEGLLDQVYQHDVGMFEDIETLAGELESLHLKQEDPAAVAIGMVARIDEVERKFLKRGEMLTGVGE